MPPTPGAHRRRRRQHIGRHRLPTTKGVPLPGLLLAGCLAGSTALFTASSPAAPIDAALADPGANRAAEVAALLNDRIEVVDEKTLARSMQRSVAASPSPSPTPSPTPTVQGPPAPVAGLVQAQMNNAATIVEVGRSMGLSRWGIIIGVATAMQESNLYNTASSAVPESFDYPHEGQGSDHDSVGLFQQRPSQGWGSVSDLMQPAYQARKFFERLSRLDYENMALTDAAQAVQISAYPYAYAKHESRATTIVDALL